MIGAAKLLMLLAVGLASGVGAVLNALYGPRARARKRLRDASRELKDGAVVTLTGVVRANGATLTAPLSGREVVAYRSAGRIFVGDGRFRRLDAEVWQQDSVSFVLETKEAAVTVEADTVALEYAPEPLIPRKVALEQQFLAANGHPRASMRDTGFDEVAITPGLEISVHGVVRIEIVGGDGDYREAGKKVVLAGHPAHPLTIGRPV